MHDLPLTITLPILLKSRPEYGDKGLSLGELSRHTGVPEPTIWRIREGESKDPRRSNVEKIAAFFGLTYEQIYDIEYVRSLVATGGIREDAPHYGNSLDLETLKDKLLSLPEDERQEAAKFLLDAVLDPKNLKANSARQSSESKE